MDSLTKRIDDNINATFNNEFRNLLYEVRKALDKCEMKPVIESSPSIYDLKLHESTAANENLTATRVPGGWIYSVWDTKRQLYVRNIFVSFNNEFMTK